MNGRFERAGVSCVALHLAAATILTAALLAAAPSACADSWRVNGLGPDARLHIREAADADADVLGYVPGNARGIISRACVGNWCEIEYNGLRGWVYKPYLIPDNVNAAAPAENPDAAGTVKRHGGPGEADLADLPRRKTINLAATDGRPHAVYAFPDAKLPVSGLIAPDVRQVDGLGTCMRAWCYIRSGGLIGWMPVEAFDLTEGATGATPKPPAAQTPAAVAGDEGSTLNKTETTASNVAIAANAGAIGKVAQEQDSKFYALAGLTGDGALPIHDQPDGGAAILAWIPRDAKDIEGMKKCQDRWCMVRWQATTGWVTRRHLVDEAAATQIFQVTGLPLWAPLKVLDEPAEGAGEIGTIPSYATGIVPIGMCNQYWCHVRYLGIAGWVSARHLQPQAR